MRLLRGDIHVGQDPVMSQAMFPNGASSQSQFNGGGPFPNGGLPQPANCPMTVVSNEVEVPADGEASLNVGESLPGRMCPQQMILSVESGGPSLADLFVTSIRSGRRDQVLSGRINAQIFSMQNPCCYAGCLPCICAPGVPYIIGLENDDDMDAADVTVTLFGQFTEWCPPDGSPPPPAQYVLPPGCLYDDAFVGIDVVIPASGVFEAEIANVGGIFCPRRIFASGTNVATMKLTEFTSGRLGDIIGSGVPLTVFGFDIECCPQMCFRCQCAPGVPIRIEVTGTPGDEAHIDIIGGFRDVC